MIDALVIGAGPAGLMAAEVLSAGGARVIVAEAMPSPARKLLMAGKSGLNLTKDEGFDIYRARFQFGPGMRDPAAFFGDPPFGPAEVMEWARGLGISLFTGSTGRVFPVGMKASPLLRAWLGRLQAQGAQLRTRWRWVGLEPGSLRFDTPEGPQKLSPKVTVLAMGGASWPRLGSDAAWVPILRGAGVEIADFQPANMGFHVAWSPPMARHFGMAVKGTAIHAGNLVSRGEWIVSRQGVEGGAIYEVAAALRNGTMAYVDLMPDLDHTALQTRFARPKARLSMGNWLRRIVGDPVKVALMLEWARPLPADPHALARLVKALPLRVEAPFGLERAISAAGGLRWSALGPDLQLSALPGLFAAGEMLDWEAPTGGYLLSGCLSSGRSAGKHALARLRD